ncbi:Zn-ribbon domain-containing OB-fold protein [Comamonas testosteroni]|uniref:Zn-ribbon domain-containing OB-fold protein n=1 Tax=Comamonas testosteroni TaxID=285 RepID=UPI0009B862C5|nr:OB-fold domain-containing protein [Comamonas testosteroni]
MSSLTPKDHGVQARYFDYLASGQWRIPVCTDCSKSVFFPRQICPNCGGVNFLWITPKGTGTIYSKSVIPGSEKNGGAYCIVLVDMDDGFRMMSRMHNLPPEETYIGMRVKSLLACLDGMAQPQVLFEPIIGI